MKIIKSIASKSLAILVAGVLFIGLFPYIYKVFPHTPRHVVMSPDKQYRIEYHNILFIPFLENPRIGGTACTECPGYIKLVNNRNSRVLNYKFYSMKLQIMSRVIWYEDSVRIPAFISWDLPRKIKKVDLR